MGLTVPKCSKVEAIIPCINLFATLVIEWICRCWWSLSLIGVGVGWGWSIWRFPCMEVRFPFCRIESRTLHSVGIASQVLLSFIIGDYWENLSKVWKFVHGERMFNLIYLKSSLRSINFFLILSLSSLSLMLPFTLQVQVVQSQWGTSP